MKFPKKIKRIRKLLMEYSLYFVILVLLLLGGWCVPPKWTEKVLNEIKAKYSVERIIENEKV